MERYYYHEAVKDDVKRWLDDFFEYGGADISDYDGIDDLISDVNDKCFMSDSVTGNASGSYTISRWRAEENLCHNMDLLEEAIDEFGDDIGDIVRKGAETCDVIVRCYVLGQVCGEAVTEYVRERFPDFVKEKETNDKQEDEE